MYLQNTQIAKQAYTLFWIDLHTKHTPYLNIPILNTTFFCISDEHH